MFISQENRNKWWNAIGNNIKKGRSHRNNLFVCNQHFAENCFQRELIEVLRDGCEVSLPRKCVTLKKDSVPSIFEVSVLNLKRRNCLIQKLSTNLWNF